MHGINAAFLTKRVSGITGLARLSVHLSRARESKIRETATWRSSGVPTFSSNGQRSELGLCSAVAAMHSLAKQTAVQYVGTVLT